MKRVTCAIFNSINIKDLNLTLRRHEPVDIPDEMFRVSKDLQKAIKNSFVKVEQPKAFVGTVRESVPHQNFETRLNAIENSISFLLQKENASPKYEDYFLYNNTF